MSHSLLIWTVRLQDQVEHGGMLQPVLCKVGTHNVFLVMVKSVTPLLRYDEYLSYCANCIYFLYNSK